jgi:uncharacterized membrane protein YvbJ
MYCPKCGAPNQDGTAFCSACGAPLTQAAPASQAGWTPQPPQSKNALVAAFLNLFWGIGYLYLGYKKVLGIPSVLFVILMLIVYFVLAIFTIGIGTLILAIILAIDGYQKAKGGSGFVGAQR